MDPRPASTAGPRGLCYTIGGLPSAEAGLPGSWRPGGVAKVFSSGLVAHGAPREEELSAVIRRSPSAASAAPRRTPLLLRALRFDRKRRVPDHFADGLVAARRRGRDDVGVEGRAGRALLGALHHRRRGRGPHDAG